MVQRTAKAVVQPFRARAGTFEYIILVADKAIRALQIVYHRNRPVTGRTFASGKCSGSTFEPAGNTASFVVFGWCLTDVHADIIYAYLRIRVTSRNAAVKSTLDLRPTGHLGRPKINHQTANNQKCGGDLKKL
jgi:hypothetical protein